MTDFADRMYVRTKIHELKEILDIACAPGNYDYDPYMQGLANGLILAHAILINHEPTFMSAPSKWGHEKNNKDEPEPA